MIQSYSRRSRILVLSTVAALVMFGFEPKHIAAEEPVLLVASPEVTAVKETVQRFFELYKSKDIEGMAPLWCADSPHWMVYRDSLKVHFSEVAEIELAGLSFDSIEFDRARTTAKVTVTRVVRAKRVDNGAFHESFPDGPLQRVLRLDHEQGRWKVCFYGLPEELAEYEQPVVADRPDVAEVKLAVRQYYDAYATEEMDTFLSRWIPDSPHLSARRERQAQIFSEFDRIQVPSMRFRFVKFAEGGTFARVRVDVVVIGLNLKSGIVESVGNGEVTLQLRRRAERWLVWGHLNEFDELVDSLAVAPNRAARRDLLEEVVERDAETQEFMRKVYTVWALLRIDDPQRRRQILLEEPALYEDYGLPSWVLTRALRPELTFDKASRLLEIVEQMSDFYDNLVLVVSCQLHRGILYEQHAKYAEALQSINRAREILGSDRPLDDLNERLAQMIISIHLGRVHVQLKQFGEARKEFEAANADYVNIASRSLDPNQHMLAERYLFSLQRRDKLDREYNTLVAEGNLTKAEERSRQVLAIENDLYGPVHIDIVYSHANLARLAAYQDRFDEALTSANQALALSQMLYGESNGHTRAAQWELQHVQRLQQLAPDERSALRDLGTFKLSMVARGATDDAAIEAARLRVESALETARRVLGEEDYLTASARVLLAEIAKRLGKKVKADEFYSGAIPVFRRIFGRDVDGYQRYDDQWLSLLELLMLEHSSNCDFREGQRWKQKLIAQTEASFGRESMQANRARAKWAFVDRAAELPKEQIERLRETLALFKEMQVLVEKRNVAEVERISEQIITVFNEILGEEFSQTTEAFVVAAEVAMFRGDSVRAEAMARAAIPNQLSNPRNRFRLLRVLYTACLMQGRFVEAEKVTGETVEAARDAYGDTGAPYVAALKEYTAVLSFLGQDSRAFELIVKAARIQKRRLLPKEHPEFNSTKLLVEFADENVLGNSEHRLYAELLGSIGDWFSDQKEQQIAIQFLSAAAKLLERVDGKRDSKDYVGIVIDLIRAYDRVGDRVAARRLTEQTLVDVERLNATGLAKYLQSRQLATLNQNLSAYDWEAGRIDLAEVRLARVVELLSQTSSGLGSPEYAEAILILAEVQFALGKHDLAIANAKRGAEMEMLTFQDALRHGSEAVMRAFIAQMHGPTTLHQIAAAIPDERVRARYGDFVFNWSLQYQAIVTESLCQLRERQLLFANNPQIARLASELNAARQESNNLALNPPENRTKFELDSQSKVLQQRAEKLEAEFNQALSQASSENGKPATAEREISITDVRQRIADNAVLVNFIRVPAFDWKDRSRGPDHYHAFVLRHDPSKPVQFIDLGEAAAIDELVARYRETFNLALRSYKATQPEDIALAEADWEAELHDTSRALHELLIEPLKTATGNASMWYVVPEGQLNRLPFEALLAADDKYVVESTRIAYLTRAQDLLRPEVTPGAGTAIFAAAEFNRNREPKASPASQAPASDKQPPPSQNNLAPLAHSPAAPVRVALRGDVSQGVRGMRFDPLDATAVEARQISELLNGTPYGPVTSNLGAQALEENLKSLAAPRILHLATHGFFLEDMPKEKLPASDGSAGASGQSLGYSRLRGSDNPLMRSGIVLTGADRLGQAGTGEDGWITAQEIALLNLKGTELVVLSACESGLGKIETGEGVQGLKVAFRYAGARTLISTLFQVPDQPTQQLMHEFYSHLKAGESKLDSLHKAQLSIIESRRQSHGSAHPLFWGSFVLTGDPD